MTILAHSTDPTTSHHAAVTLDHEGRQTLKDALLQLLAEHPRTGDELTRAYYANAERNLWPLFTDHHNVKRRLSELHTIHHVIRPTSERRPSQLGKPATVWELTVPLDEARVIVAARLDKP